MHSSISPQSQKRTASERRNLRQAGRVGVHAHVKVSLVVVVVAGDGDDDLLCGHRVTFTHSEEGRLAGTSGTTLLASRSCDLHVPQVTLKSSSD